ncbi:hypothetical protein DDE01_18990 [Desulfovibrio desulfuricans]|nr:hypothetical protein DDE01_18990 [Desulfovibrio desulfuricans]
MRRRGKGIGGCDARMVQGAGKGVYVLFRGDGEQAHRGRPRRFRSRMGVTRRGGSGHHGLCTARAA